MTFISNFGPITYLRIQHHYDAPKPQGQLQPRGACIIGSGGSIPITPTLNLHFWHSNDHRRLPAGWISPFLGREHGEEQGVSA